MISYKKILIVRNDKLGDFILSLPVYALIKQYMPESKIHVLVPDYTKDIAQLCESIDSIIIDPGPSASLKQQLDTLSKIRKQHYDAVITLFSTTRVGIFSFLAGIKYRLAPATKLAQLFYNHKLIQRRSRSLKPEYEYNCDLAISYLNALGITVNGYPTPPFLKFNTDEINAIRAKFCEEYKLDINSEFIFIHPGSGGSATNLSLQQYADLAKNIKIGSNTTFVITAGPDEADIAKNLSALLNNVPHVIYHSTQGLVNFTKIIQLCDLFISGSTGPLHIAGALNRPTAAFYQRRRSATPLRWQTLNSEDRRLAFTPPEEAHESDLHTIDVIEVAKKINAKFSAC